MHGRHLRGPSDARAARTPLWCLLAAALLLAAPAQAQSPVVEVSLRDGPVPDGVADDLILPPDPNFGRIFLSSVFDAEFYLEFPVVGAEPAADVVLVLRVMASDIDLVLGESKTFRISTYAGTGVASLDSFGQGVELDQIVLPFNGDYELEIDVTDSWNDAVLAGDDFLGVRLHDPVWTGSVEGAGTIRYGSSELLPEPDAPALAAAALGSLAVLGGRARGRRAGRPRESPGRWGPDPG